MAVLERICTDWVACLQVWRNAEFCVFGLTPRVVTHHIVLPRIARACRDLPTAGDPLTAAQERTVHGLLEAQRTRLEPEIRALGVSIAYGLDEARERAVAVTPDELTSRAVQVVCSINDADPVTDGELAAVVSAYLENLAVTDIDRMTPRTVEEAGE